MFAPRSSSLAVLLGLAGLSVPAVGCSPGTAQGDYMLLSVAYADAEQDASCYVDGEVPQAIKEDTTSFRTGGTLVLFGGPDEAYYLESETAVLAGVREGDAFTFSGESVDVEYANGTPEVAILDADHDGLDDNVDDGMVDADKDGLDDNYQDGDVDTDADGLDDRDQDDEVDVDMDGLDDRFTVIEPAKDGDKLTMTIRTTVSLTISGSDITGNSETSSSATCSGASCPEELPSCKTSVAFVGTLVEDADVEHQL